MDIRLKLSTSTLALILLLGVILTGMVLIVVFSRFPYVGANNLHIKRCVRSVVGRAFGEVNVVTFYITGRAFMVTNDILPTTFLRKLIYSYECRHSDSRYVGRTIQHVNGRIDGMCHCIYYLQRRETTGHGQDDCQKFMQHELTLMKSLLNINQRGGGGGVSAEKECKICGLEGIGCVHWIFYKF